MHALEFSGTGVTVVLVCCVIAGSLTAASGWLPGNARVLGYLYAVIGLLLSMWAMRMLMTGRLLEINAAILVPPVGLTVRAVLRSLRDGHRRRAAMAAAPSVHPAARVYHGPSQTPQGPVYAYQAASGAHAAPDLPAGPRLVPVQRMPFHGHAVTPPPVVPAPAGFAPQPLHAVPTGYRYATVQAEYLAPGYQTATPFPAGASDEPRRARHRA